MEKSNLAKLVEERRKKIAKLRKLGVNPYSNKFWRPIPTARIVEDYSKLENDEKSGKEVTVAGRVMSIRGHGKAGFADLHDFSGKIQLYFKYDDLGEKWKIYELLDKGDILNAKGKPFRTKKGELTVWVKDFSILTKSVLPLPSKWYGLKDVETRYRQRYIDLIMNPHVKKTFITRSKVITAMREFLENHGFIEVETPILQPIYGGTRAKPFKTFHNKLGVELYLRISDELYLKRLIVGGFERVFEFCTDFRNEGIDTLHNPEFTQMETMCAYADYKDSMDLMERMLAFVAKKATGDTKVKYQGITLDFKPPWKRVKIVDAVEEHCGVNVKKIKDVKKMKSIATGLGVEVQEGMGVGRILAEIFKEKVEKKLVQPTIVYDYPTEVSPLAKKCKYDSSFVERFEPFIMGVEIGNVYSELNDPAELRKRLEQEYEKARAGDEEAHPLDEDFIRALEYGMPPASGIGIGIDRLVMFLTDSPSIKDVIFFPQMVPEQSKKNE